jgi:hypothetical protein
MGFEDEKWILVDQELSTVADLCNGNTKQVHKRVCQSFFIPFQSNKVLKERSKSQYMFMYTFQQPYFCDKHLSL